MNEGSDSTKRYFIAFNNGKGSNVNEVTEQDHILYIHGGDVETSDVGFTSATSADEEKPSKIQVLFVVQFKY